MENQEPVSSISHIGVKKPEESLPKADDATTGKDTLLNKKKGKKVDVYQKDEQGRIIDPKTGKPETRWGKMRRQMGEYVSSGYMAY